MSTVYVVGVSSARSAPTPEDTSDTTTLRGLFPIGATALILGDMIDMVTLPPDTNVVDMYLNVDDLDAGAAITIDAGLMAGTPGDTVIANRTVGTEFFAASTIGQAGGIQRMLKVLGARLPPAPVERSLGIKIAAAGSAVIGGMAGLQDQGSWQPGKIYQANDAVTLKNGAIVYVSAGGGGLSGTYANPQINQVVSQYGPPWQIAKGATTVDGALTWTCVSPILELVVLIKGATKLN